MDKIQKALFARITIKGTDAEGNELKPGPEKARPVPGNAYGRPGGPAVAQQEYAPAFCSLSDGVVTFRQSEDIKKTRYRLVVYGYTIENLFVVRKGKDTAVKPVARDEGEYELCYTDNYGNTVPEVDTAEQYVVDVDFDDKIDAMKIRFIRDFADDLVIPVNFVDADKDRYYAEEDRKIGEERLMAANISHSTGTSLVNIRFRPCCDEYSYATIAVYVSEGRGSTIGPRASVRDVPRLADPGRDSAAQANWVEIKSFKLKGEDMFLAVKDLADAVYAYVLTQYDRKGNELLKTGFTRFEITSYHGGGRPVNWIS